MLSKFFTRLSQTQNMTQMATRSFRATQQLNKKPSIGDAVTILQSKVSSINQVVSSPLPEHLTTPSYAPQPKSSLIYFLERFDRIRYRYLNR
jgi:hypothetical protein